MAEFVISVSLPPQRECFTMGAVSDPLITIVAFDGFQLLDVAGPLEVFTQAAQLGDPAARRYRTEVVASTATVRSSSSLVVAAQRVLGPVRAPIDTLIVAGGDDLAAALDDRQLIGWVQRAARRSRRVASVCTGAFLLAEAGLLEGRRATTHWVACEGLASLYPSTKVEYDPIFVRDGNVWTSAGVTAGMDLSLALVAEDHGPALALEVARRLVLFVQRSGGQSQWSAQLSAQAAARAPLRELQAWIADHLTDDLTIPALAARANMSTRHFARAFRAEVGMTPAAYVERVRLEAVRRELQSTAHPIDAVARRCGFQNAETLHRAFRRRMATSPAQYRRHFREWPTRQPHGS